MTRITTSLRSTINGRLRVALPRRTAEDPVNIYHDHIFVLSIYIFKSWNQYWIVGLSVWNSRNSVIDPSLANIFIVSLKRAAINWKYNSCYQIYLFQKRPKAWTCDLNDNEKCQPIYTVLTKHNMRCDRECYTTLPGLALNLKN